MKHALPYIKRWQRVVLNVFYYFPVEIQPLSGKMINEFQRGVLTYQSGPIQFN